MFYKLLATLPRFVQQCRCIFFLNANLKYSIPIFEIWYNRNYFTRISNKDLKFNSKKEHFEKISLFFIELKFFIEMYIENNFMAANIMKRWQPHQFDLRSRVVLFG